MNAQIRAEMVNDFYLALAKNGRFDDLRDDRRVFKIRAHDVYVFPELRDTSMVCVTLGAEPKVERISIEIL